MNKLKRKLKGERTSLADYLESFFHEDFMNWPLTVFQNIKTKKWNPRCELNENEDNYLLKAELPGVKEEDLEVNLEENNVLTIKAQKNDEFKEKNKENKEEYYEKSYGSFVRSFTLPDNVKTDKIKADYKNGLLRLIIPKTEKKERTIKKIEVNNK
jgi:HSP20 family protein